MVIATEGTLRTLAPAARDQVKLRDRILRATAISAEQTFKGSSTILQWEMGAYASFMVTLGGDSSSFAIDGSDDLLGWSQLDIKQVGAGSVPPAALGFSQENAAAVGIVPQTRMIGNKQSKFVRVRSSTLSFSRNTSVQVTLSQTPFAPLAPARHFGPDNAWSYLAPTGGVTGTSALALIAANNASHRRLLTQLELASDATAGTEVAILDGTTVLWRTYLPASGFQRIAFDPPLRASANAALNIQLSGATAKVYPNARGITSLA